MPVPLAIPVLSTIGRYTVKHGAKKAIQKYGDDAVKTAMKEKNLKTVGDKVVKKRMTAAQRKTQSADFNKGLAKAQKDKKGPSDKDFFAKVEADLAKQARMKKYVGGKVSKPKGKIMPKAKPC